MNQCLRCKQPCAASSDYCYECQSSLRNRLPQKDEASLVILSPSPLHQESGDHPYNSGSVVEQLRKAVEVALLTNHKPRASRLSPLQEVSSDSSPSYMSTQATVSELPTLTTSEQLPLPLAEPLEQLLPQLWTDLEGIPIEELSPFDLEYQDTNESSLIDQFELEQVDTREEAIYDSATIEQEDTHEQAVFDYPGLELEQENTRAEAIYDSASIEQEDTHEEVIFDPTNLEYDLPVANNPMDVADLDDDDTIKRAIVKVRALEDVDTVENNLVDPSVLEQNDATKNAPLDMLDLEDEDTALRKITERPAETDPLVTRHLPNSIEAAQIEEEDIRLAINQGEMVTVGLVPTLRLVSSGTASQGAVSTRRHLPRRVRVIFAALAIVAIFASAIDGLLISRSIIHTTSAKAEINSPLLTLTPGTVRPDQIVQLHLAHFSASTRVFLTHDIQENVRTDAGSPFVKVSPTGEAEVRLLAEDVWGSGFHMIEAEDVATHYTASATLQIIGDIPLRAPHLQISRSFLDMGADLQGANTIQTVVLHNTGGSWISWMASSNQPWLVVSPQQGIFRDSQSIFIAITRAHLKPGNYGGAVTFISNTGNPIVAQVKMSVLPLPASSSAVMTVTSPALSFTATDGAADPASQQLTISNPGSRPLNWSLSTNSLTVADNQILPSDYNGNWLTTNVAKGTVSPGSTEKIQVTLQSSTLLPSVYSGIFIFASGHGQSALNNPQAVAVSLTVQPRCGVATSLGGLSFNTSSNHGNPNTQSLSLNATVGCAGDISWQTYSSASWLEVTPASGRLHQNTTMLAAIGVNIETLLPGTYNAFIVFLTDKRAQTLMVQLTILASSSTAQSPTMVIAGQPTPQCVASFQGCTTPISGTPLPGTPLPVTTPGNPIPTAFPGTPQPTVGQVTPTPTPGGTPVPTPPIVNISPLALNFSASQGQNHIPGQIVTISNSGGSTLYWQASSDSSASWLSIASLGGSIAANQTQQLKVNVDTSGLKRGTYTAQISIVATDSSGSQVQGSPQTVPVTLNIVQPCTLQVAPSSLFFTATLVQTNPPGQSFMLKESGNCARPISWTATIDLASSSWITISAASGEDNGNGSTIVVTVNAKNLTTGTYSGWATVSAISSDGSTVQNSPQVVSIMLTVVL